MKHTVKYTSPNDKKNSIKQRFSLFIKPIYKTPKSIFIFGFIVAFGITLKEVLALSYNNFQIFYFGSTDFWLGTNPYSDWFHLNLKGKPLDVFIYLPLFSILFTPFTFLPNWLGAFCWNFFTYTIFYLSIFTLPATFNFKEKRFIFFISCLLLFATQLSMQFNPIVAALFLFSFSLLEKKQNFWAILLISISGFTKVYGIFQLIMLFFYPKFWKNIFYSFFIGISLLILPLIRYNSNELISNYKSWINAISSHSTKVQDFYSIYRPIYAVYSSINEYASIISILILLGLFILTLYKIKAFKKSIFLRTQFIGILMSWLILFGLGSEQHTYVIAMIGYAIWYITIKKSKLDKVLLWLNFILLAVFPIDIICPTIISDFVLGKLHLAIIVFFITWILMIYKTYNSKTIS